METDNGQESAGQSTGFRESNVVPKVEMGRSYSKIKGQ